MQKAVWSLDDDFKTAFLKSNILLQVQILSYINNSICVSREIPLNEITCPKVLHWPRLEEKAQELP